MRLKNLDFRGIRILTLAVWVLSGWAFPVSAQLESLCATVKIEIVQELTLERQAFDARMRINNGLDTLDLEDVLIEVLFMDEDENPVLATSDPNDTTATFFIRVDSLDGIADVTGAGTIAAASDAEVHFLIIPSPGAAEGLPQGKQYLVGATLSYTLGGEPQTVEVVPDTITVKPQPLLALDYFLEREVYADDAFTPEIEPPEPFTLGVRVQNNGSGLAQSVKIDSAQPRITENELGLLIGFEITGSSVDDEPAAPTLLIDFGEIESNMAKVGRWEMETTLSGEFTDFSAEFSHSDELGGQLTSLIEGVGAHLLVQDVRVDIAGRDAVRDFLALDGDTLRVYESDGVDTVVTDSSASATLVAAGGTVETPRYTLTVPQTAGMLSVRLPDPEAGLKSVRRVVRGDGKVLPEENGWISKTRNETTNDFDYFVNVFDVDGGGTYTLTLGDPIVGPLPPVLGFIANRAAVEGATVSFIIQSSDPNGTIPSLSTGALPIGATFVDDGTGSGIFTWNTGAGQAGTYPLTFRASDGALQDQQVMTIRINSPSDSDGDGLDDAWELSNFGTLDNDGSGDSDGDGISDLEEFLAGTDPNSPDNAPPAPMIASPLYDTEVSDLFPALAVTNASPAFLGVQYEFELFAGDDFGTSIDDAPGLAETTLETSWTPSLQLAENEVYSWRVRSVNGSATATSEWVYGRFRVSGANDPPTVQRLTSPVDGGVTPDLLPILEATAASDPEGGLLEYGFLVSLDSEGVTIIGAAAGLSPDTDGAVRWAMRRPLDAGETYYWWSTATDEEGAVSVSPVSSFTVDVANQSPGVPSSLTPRNEISVVVAGLELAVGNSLDPESDTLSYEIEVDTEADFSSGGLLNLGLLPEMAVETVVSVPGLADDTLYYWRARAFDGVSYGPWATTSFRTNNTDDAPRVSIQENPANLATVNVTSPRLAVFSATDPEADISRYEFEVFTDVGLTQIVAAGSEPDPAWYAFPPLSIDQTYYWRARSVDAANLPGPWSEAWVFKVDPAASAVPTFEFQEPSSTFEVVNNEVEIRWVDLDPRQNAEITLFANGVEIAADLREDGDRGNDRFVWDVTGLAAGSYSLTASISGSSGLETASACCPVIIVRRACEDGIDNNLDGEIDLADPGCLAPTDDSEVAGDLDYDGDVDADDRLLFLDTFASAAGDSAFSVSADFDTDGIISFIDLHAWEQARTAYEEEVPEPALLALLCAGMAALGVLGRRRVRAEQRRMSA